MHNIEYFTYDYNVDKNKVQRELDSYAERATWGEGGHDLGQKIRWLNDTVYGNYDTAEQAIRLRDRKFYDQLAVPYWHRTLKDNDPKLSELTKKVDETDKAYKDYNRVIWANTVMSEFVSCRTCKSKLKRELVKTNFCPVCSKDLRPPTMLKTLKSLSDKSIKAAKKRSEFIGTHGMPVKKWLVKIEYHT